MLAVAVDVEVVEGGEEAFIAASLANCQRSVKEPGVTRFDFMQNNDNPRNFLLFEVYNNPNGPVEHKATGGRLFVLCTCILSYMFVILCRTYDIPAAL